MHTCNFNTEFMLKFPLNRPFLFLDQSPFKFYSVVTFWFFIFSQICSYLQFSSTALSETKISITINGTSSTNTHKSLRAFIAMPTNPQWPAHTIWLYEFSRAAFFVIKNQFVAIDLLLFGPIWSFFLFHLSSIHFLHQNRLSFVCIISYEAPP